MNEKNVLILPFLKVFALSALLILTIDSVLIYACDKHFNWTTLILLLVIPSTLTVTKFVSKTNRIPDEVERIKFVWASLAGIIIYGTLNAALRHGINILRGSYTLFEWAQMFFAVTIRGWIGIFALLLFALMGCYVFLNFIYGTFAGKLAERQNGPGSRRS